MVLVNRKKPALIVPLKIVKSDRGFFLNGVVIMSVSLYTINPHFQNFLSVKNTQMENYSIRNSN